MDSIKSSGKQVQWKFQWKAKGKQGWTDFVSFTILP